MGTSDLTEERALDIAKLWWLFLVLGVISVIAGVIFVAEPSNSIKALAVVFGIFALIDGIIELVLSFSHHTENRALAAILGVLGIVVGIILIRHPSHAAAAIGLLIGIWLVAAGVVRLMRALVASAHPVLQIVIALLEIVFGILIVSEPHIGYSTLAIIVGIWLIINGVIAIVMGFAVRSARDELKSDAASSG
jgi:uncharacterized membrane protein HdeD (DUF308 family)